MKYNNAAFGQMYSIMFKYVHIKLNTLTIESKIK